MLLNVYTPLEHVSWSHRALKTLGPYNSVFPHSPHSVYATLRGGVTSHRAEMLVEINASLLMIQVCLKKKTKTLSRVGC